MMDLTAHGIIEDNCCIHLASLEQLELILKKVVIMSPYYGTTDTLCSILQLTLPRDFKPRVDAALSVLSLACDGS